MQGKTKLIVAMKDEIHLDRICDYIEKEGSFSTERFSLTEPLEQRLLAGAPFQIIIYERDILPVDVAANISQIKAVFSAKTTVDEENQSYEIAQYQKLEHIISDLYKIFSVDERFTGITTSSASASDTQTLLFTSPVGGAGATTLALGTGMHLSRLGHRTLYLNLESCGTLSPFLSGYSKQSVTQILRMVIEKNTKLLPFIESERLVEPTTKLEYFDIFNDITDLTTLESSHVLQLVAQLEALGLYEYIILDINWNTELVFPLFDVLPHSYILTRNTNLATSKINTFIEQVVEKNYSFLKRIRIILNAVSGQVNPKLRATPYVQIPVHLLLVDDADFVGTITGSNPLGSAMSHFAAGIINEKQEEKA